RLGNAGVGCRGRSCERRAAARRDRAEAERAREGKTRMTPANLQFLCGFLKKRSGLVIAADKAYLIESRLNPVARRLGHASLDAMTETLRTGRSPALEGAVVEAMATNESSFFRDKGPFERLKAAVLPRLLEARKGTKELKIWCAAAATGQEPYSIA